MPPPDPESLRKAAEDASAARGEARRAAIRLARDRGAGLITRPAWPGAQTDVQDVRPLDGTRSARDIELGARFTAREYIRAAREAGHSWQEIGQALGVTPGGEAGQGGETVADAAHTYAAGRPDPEAPWRPRFFYWHCQSCDRAISDYGLSNGPADDEQGHAENCPRLAAAVAGWDADWEAEP